MLQGSGGDGIFGNGNSPNDKFYNLSGKVTYVASANELVINVGAAGLTLPNDEYRITLLGSGANVIADPQGDALDGINTLNNDPNNPQLALPSGNGFPGSNFYTTFVVNTTAPSVVPGSFMLAPATDSNIVGDFVTNITKPSFVGQIKVAQPAIDPLAGQTVILDVSTAGNGVYDLLNAGTAVTNANGTFTVTVGTDAANTGLVKVSSLPNSPYIVGPSGILNPIIGETGDSYFRVRVIDQSGNVSDQPTDSDATFASHGALTRAVIDTTPPVITSLLPTPNTLLTPDASGNVTFTFTVNKNLDPSSLNASNFLVTRAGPDGILGTADDVSVPVVPGSITYSYLKNGPKGPMQISFKIGGLVNDVYQIDLSGTTSSPIRDVAGNPLQGGFDFKAVYVVENTTPQLLFVANPGTFTTNTSAALGSRANPYSTIASALAKASPGEIVAVLPGVYTESIALRPYVRLLSADPTSTNTNFVNGNARATIIRAPAITTNNTTPNITVSAINVPLIAGATTEIGGFSIASPLNDNGNNAATGPIDQFATAVFIYNSDILVDRDYILDAGNGIQVFTAGANAPYPDIQNDGIIGNTFGISTSDTGTTTSIAKFLNVDNDTFAFNTVGMNVGVSASGPGVAIIANNIFWENHDQTSARAGYAIISTAPNKLIMISNLFYGNGPSDTSTKDDTINIGGGFDPTVLSTTTPDPLGNYTGKPVFVSPRDPRPGSDGPAIFFIDGNYDTTVNSASIDTANETFAPTLDFLNRPRVKIAGRGFPGTGPADVGAFEYTPATTSSSAISALSSRSFQVANTSLAASGAEIAAGASFAQAGVPGSITVDFTQNVNQSSVNATDLILSGSGLSAANPAHVSSLSWVDGHTVTFNLTKGFNSSGTVDVAIPAGSIMSQSGTPIQQFKDYFTINPSATGSTSTSSSSTSLIAVATVTSAPAASASAPTVTTVVSPTRCSTDAGPRADLGTRSVAVQARQDSESAPPYRGGARSQDQEGLTPPTPGRII